MGKGNLEGLPTHGTDATGADTYAEVIAAPSGSRQYRHLIAVASSNPAMLSLDAGTTDHVWIPAAGTVAMDDVEITQAVHAKNGTAGSNYTALHVVVW